MAMNESSLPTEIKSTPVCAISLTVLKLIPPEASKTAIFIIFDTF